MQSVPPNDLTSLDQTAANILQISVPDPSSTFLDLGDSNNCASMYENDFDLDILLPPNFNMNQLDNNLDINSGNLSPTNGGLSSLGETSMALTNKTIMGDNNNMSCQQQPTVRI